MESQTIEYALNPSKFKDDLEVAILEGKITVQGAIDKIDNILTGSDSSDISEAERRSFEEIKSYLITALTNPSIQKIIEEDLTKDLQEELRIGGKFNPDDPNLPQKVKDRIEEARKEGYEIPYFYDKITGNIFINENADSEEIRAGIAREWAIRNELEAGKGKENHEGEEKATVSGIIAFNEVRDRTRDKGKGIDILSLEYGEFDSNSEITSDFTYKHIGKFFDGAKSVGGRLLKGNLAGAVGEAGKLLGDTARVIKRDIDDLKSGGEPAKKVIKESIEAIPKYVGEEVKKADAKQKEEIKKKNDEKKRIEKELASSDCNGKCVKEQQKIYEDYITDAGDLLSCRTSDRKGCNPNPNNTSELIIFKTDKELVEYSNKLKELGIRGNYRLDSQERIDKNYNNSSNRSRQATDYENVLNSKRNTGKSEEELYKEGQITQRQYENYKKERDYIDKTNSYSNIWNNSVKPIWNSVYTGINEDVIKAYKQYEISSGSGSLYNNSSSPTISQSNRNSIENNTGQKLEIETKIKENFDNLSQHEKDMFNKYEQNGWRGQVSGGPSNAGGVYRNDSKLLPEGNTYKEFDVNVRIPGASRDSVRFVSGSDGSVYYTNDHYQTFTRIK